jgi:glycosyltransferase involved in cell wall biosynthesis
MKRTRIIHVITRFDRGGSAENTFLTVAGLNREAHDVVLVMGLSHESDMGTREHASVEENISRLREQGVRIVILPKLLRRVGPVSDLKASLALWRLFRRERPEIVHTHTSKAGILGRWAAWSAGVPVIVHTPHGHVFWGYFGPAKTRLFILLERLTALITDRLVMLTEQERRDHLRFRVAPEEQFTTIHSGVDLERFAASAGESNRERKCLGIPDGAFVVGAVGRLTAVKGHRHLLHAARRVIDCRGEAIFVILGTGELLGELRRQVAALGIEANVRFAGWQPDAASIMSAFDLFAFPSINEGMGKALVEAMALEKPVVASRIGGIVDLVNDGVNGFLVPPADPEALADRILFLMEDPETGRRMAGKAAETAASYGSAAMAGKIEHLYGDLLSRSGCQGALACRPAEP